MSPHCSEHSVLNAEQDTDVLALKYLNSLSLQGSTEATGRKQLFMGLEAGLGNVSRMVQHTKDW